VEPKGGVRFLEVGASRIACFDRGEGDALLLIHGMFGDHLDWEPVLEPLSRRHRVVAPDLPGFGDSEKPDCEYTEEIFTSALEGLLSGLEIQRATVVGNSFGGILAQIFALRCPERVDRLILVGSGGFRRRSTEEGRTALERFNEQTIRAMTPELIRQIFAPVFARQSPERERYIERQIGKLARPDYPAYARAIERSIQLALRLYTLDRLAEIRVPVLLLWGEKDLPVPLAEAQLALAQLRHGRLEVFAGCGHAPQLEDPAAFVRAVEAFTEDGVR